MATNTTATSVQHNGNGSTASFAIPFSFLANAEVDVTVGGVLKTLGTHYNISGSTVTFTSGNIPPSGTNNIKFQRDTNISTKKVDFQDGSVLTETDLDTNSDQVLFAQQEITDKLSGIEDGATADQTDEEIQDIVGAMFSGNTESGITATYQDSDGTIDLTVASQTDNNFTNADHSKLDGIETGATADQTDAEIKTAYENNSDTNAFTDAEKTKLQNLDLSKLQGIETGATADQSNAEIKTAYEANSDTNAFTDAEKTKLAGISASAGATTFVGLGDTPANFTSAAGKTVKVNSSANALEFVDQISDVVGDTTPQLGGDLDVQAREINTSTANGNIKLNPNGSGAVEVKGDGSSNDGKLQLNCSQNSHGVKLQSPAHSAGQSYTMILPDNQIAADKFLKVKSITGSGATAVGQLEYADGGGGATGGGGEKIFHESENTMDNDYTISANHNAIVPTPLTINATLTVGATSTVTFV